MLIHAHVQHAGRPRLQGELAVSRALGDRHYQQYGLSSEPELSGWEAIEHHNQVLVLASDGIFEHMDGAGACATLEAAAQGALSLLSLTSWSTQHRYHQHIESCWCTAMPPGGRQQHCQG